MSNPFEGFRVNQKEFTALFTDFIMSPTRDGKSTLGEHIKTLSPEEVAGLSLMFASEIYRNAVDDLKGVITELSRENDFSSLIIENARLKVQIRKLEAQQKIYNEALN